MSNVLINYTNVAKKILAMMQVKSSLLMTCNKDYQSDQVQQVNGWKPGMTIRVAKPNYFLGQRGISLSTPEDILSDYAELTIDDPYNVLLETDFVEESYKLSDQHFNEQIVMPSGLKIAADIEEDLMGDFELNVWNYVGSTSSYINDTDILNQAIEKMQLQGIPIDTYSPFMAIDPVNARYLKQSYYNKFLPSLNDSIVKQMSLGRVAGLEGLEIYTNNLCRVHTAGTASAQTGLQVAGAVTSGNSIVIDQGSSAFTVKAGDIFYIDSVYSVHNITKESTGQLMQFVAQADVTAADLGGGNYGATVTVQPSIVSSSTSSRRNVSNAISNNADVTFEPSHRVSCVYIKPGITCALPPFKRIRTTDGANYTDPKTRVSMTVMRQGQILAGSDYFRMTAIAAHNVWGEYCVKVISKV
jgi:hypothetical protein